MSRNLIQLSLGLGMLVLIIATWGSIGSGLTLFGLILLVMSVLNQRIQEKGDEIFYEEDDYSGEE